VDPRVWSEKISNLDQSVRSHLKRSTLKRRRTHRLWQPSDQRFKPTEKTRLYIYFADSYPERKNKRTRKADFNK
jgi:hypothetical protein